MKWLSAAALAVAVLTAPGAAAQPTRGRFDERAAFAFLQRQVALGPRPAGSAASRRLAAIIRAQLPGSRYQAVPGGLRNVVKTVPGRNPRRIVVVGAHYDTKDMAGFVGANDGASGTAVLLELARKLKPKTVRPTVVFVFFDGEESPPGSENVPFEQAGLRGSRVAAQAYRRAEAMVRLDMIGDRSLSIPRATNSNRALWAKVRTAAQRAGRAWAFPPQTRGPILDDHIPFARAGVPSVDVIDFTFPCWHQTCDDLRSVAPRSLDAVGETMVVLLRSF